jgi:hypothetical protein
MFYAYDVLESDDLISIYVKPDKVKEVGGCFVFQNHNLQEHLHLAGVFETLPKVLEENDPEAERLYNDVDFEGWFSNRDMQITRRILDEMKKEEENTCAGLMLICRD